ncbi:MAG: hypothetical protein HY724_05675 [Candidatus Rokubacteria bacterium]|nr:hypothetical protein [Candidatus Rokubacteria bacterium]
MLNVLLWSLDPDTGFLYTRRAMGRIALRLEFCVGERDTYGIGHPGA